MVSQSKQYQSLKKGILLTLGGIACFCLGTVALAVSGTSGAQGIGAVAGTVKNNLGNIAQLITAGAYVAGMGFGVGSSWARIQPPPGGVVPGCPSSLTHSVTL